MTSPNPEPDLLGIVRELVDIVEDLAHFGVSYGSMTSNKALRRLARLRTQIAWAACPKDAA